MDKRFYPFKQLFGLLVLLCLILGLSQPAIASVHTYPEGADQVMVRSLQTLRDRTDHAWQVVLFHRRKSGQTDSLHLRLVGFPEVTELEHPHPLRITTGTEQVFSAGDLWMESYLPLNTGEYDVLDVITQLDTNTPLRLALPTKNHAVELLVPPFVVQEWRQVASPT